MQNDRLSGHQEAAHSYRLSIFRVAAGKQYIFRMLSQRLDGLFTHFKNKRSHYCPGKDCNCQYHNVSRVWKGYLAAERYEQGQNLWFPEILEVTEYLELDFRGTYQRGQVWKIERKAEKTGQTNPVTGRLLETRDGSSFPPAHKILDTLRHVYHDSGLCLGQENPLPSRTYVTCSEGEPPIGFAPTKVEEPLKPGEFKKVIETLKNRFQMPSKNGEE
jgi:hypothetical protein